MAKAKWVKSGNHCPGCGSAETWVKNDDGDYYVGPDYVCLSCGAKGYMWETICMARKQELDAIRRIAGQVDQPGDGERGNG